MNGLCELSATYLKYDSIIFQKKKHQKYNYTLQVHWSKVLSLASKSKIKNVSWQPIKQKMMCAYL